VSTAGPRSLLVLEHEDGSSRLIKMNLATGQCETPPEWSAVESRAIASPADPEAFVYTRNGSLMLHTCGIAPDRLLPVETDRRSARHTLFSPEGTVLAAAVAGGLLLEPVWPGAPNAAPRQSFAWAPGFATGDMLWTRAGLRLLVLVHPESRPWETALVAVQPTSKLERVLPSERVSRLLGWQRSTNCLLVAFADEHGNPAAGSLAANGKQAALFEIPEGCFAESYLASQDALLIGSCGEHGSDPVEYCLLRPGEEPSPLLPNHPSVFDLAFSASETHAVFVERLEEQRSGNVWLVEMESGFEQRILEGHPEGRSYSCPALL
jgi:hypothetical protein